MIEREYKGHTVRLLRTSKDGVPRWIASARIMTPFGPICVSAIVGEDVLQQAHGAMMRAAKKLRDGAEVSGLDGDNWADVCGEFSEIGAEQSYQAVVKQIDRVVRDPAVQELASWIPFVNIAAKAAGVATRAAVLATDPQAPPATQPYVAPARPARAYVAPAPPPAQRFVSRPRPAPAPAPPPRPPVARVMAQPPPPLPMLPPRVARTAALVGRARAGDPMARETLRLLQEQATAGNQMAVAVTKLASRLLEAGVPPMTREAANMLENTAPVSQPAVIIPQDYPGPNLLDQYLEQTAPEPYLEDDDDEDSLEDDELDSIMDNVDELLTGAA